MKSQMQGNRHEIRTTSLYTSSTRRYDSTHFLFRKPPLLCCATGLLVYYLPLHKYYNQYLIGKRLIAYFPFYSDTDMVERARALLFSWKTVRWSSPGGTENRACVASLIKPYKLSGIDPRPYLTDALAHQAAQSLPASLRLGPSAPSP
jgi:hypothetical protein